MNLRRGAAVNLSLRRTQKFGHCGSGTNEDSALIALLQLILAPLIAQGTKAAAANRSARLDCFAPQISFRKQPRGQKIYSFFFSF